MSAPHTHGGTDAPECVTCHDTRPPATGLVAAFRNRLRLAGNAPAPTRWWADDLAAIAEDHFAARTTALSAENARLTETLGRVRALHSRVHMCPTDETGDDEYVYDPEHGQPCPTRAALGTTGGGECVPDAADGLAMGVEADPHYFEWNEA